MNKKVIRTIAAVTAAALLGGGIYLLVKNDVAQKINWRDILIYAPTPIARETLDEAVDIEKSKPSADRVPEDTKEELTEQVRQLSNEHDDSVGWLYIPDTNIDYPIMQSGDNEYYTRRAVDGSYLYAGSLFMDYRCSSDFSDFNSVIYGHNMGNGTMFADIPNYENEQSFITELLKVSLIQLYTFSNKITSRILYKSYISLHNNIHNTSRITNKSL